MAERNPGTPGPERSARADKPMWHRLIQLDHSLRQSLQGQLRERMVEAILQGRIACDVALPSTRELARQLGIARNTVVLAYQHLADEAWLVARERRGYFVNPEILAGRVSLSPPGVAELAHGGTLNEGPVTVLDPRGQRNIELPLDWTNYPYPFIYGKVDPGLFPVNDWRESVRLSLHVGAIRQWADDRVDHDDELLVEQIINRVLPRRGVWARPEQLLITTGAQNALFLSAQLLLGAGDRFGIEDPCYPDARNMFSLLGGTPELFAVGADGVQLDARLADCKLVYVTPSHQCPTTSTMPLAARKQLLDMASRNDVTVIEDDYESELNFVGEPTPALKSLDTEERVIYVGSLSKSLAPGLRVGFMVGPAGFIAKARALRRLMYRHPPTNTQRTVAHFLALGHHDSALLRLTQAFRQRWQSMDAALTRHWPNSAVAPAFGGSAFWVSLPAGVKALTLERQAREQGILLSAGDNYFAEPATAPACCRLGFSSIEQVHIEPGIERLAGVVQAHSG